MPSSGSARAEPPVIALAPGLDAECDTVRHALEVVVAEHRERLAAARIEIYLHHTAAEGVMNLVERRIGRLDPQTQNTLRTQYARTEHAYVAALQAVVISCEPAVSRPAADLALAVWHEIGHALLADAISARSDELDHLVDLSPSWIQRRLSTYQGERRVHELMAWLYAVATTHRWQMPAWIHPTLRETLIELLG